MSNTTFNSTSSVETTDIEGNIYKSAKIGTQVWMTENLRVTTFKDRTPISLYINNTSRNNMGTPNYSWYNNNSNNKNTYGALYNWYSVNTGKLCPYGWHVPSTNEWNELIFHLGRDYQAGLKLKEKGTDHWKERNDAITNETGFTALPGGYRWNNRFEDMSSKGYWWSSDENIGKPNYGAGVCLDDEDFIGIMYSMKEKGMSVRCLKDN